MTTAQQSLNFTPGLTAQFRTLTQVCAATVYSSRGGLSAVAADLDIAPSDLCRRLSEDGDRPLTCDQVVGVIASTLDYRPIHWLIEKFLQDPDARKEAAIAAIANMAPIFADSADNLPVTLAAMAVLLFAAYVSSVRLNRSRAIAAQHAVPFHRFAQAHFHEPRGLVCHAQRAVHLVLRIAFLAGRHQVGTQNPFVKGNLAALEHRSDGHGERIKAVLALVKAGPRFWPTLLNANALPPYSMPAFGFNARPSKRPDISYRW